MIGLPVCLDCVAVLLIPLRQQVSIEGRIRVPVFKVVHPNCGSVHRVVHFFLHESTAL